MRILITGQTYYYKNNGQAVFTINLAQGLAEAGHSVRLLLPARGGFPYQRRQGRLHLQAVPTLTLPFNLNISLTGDEPVARSLAQFQPDLVHLQDHYFLSRRVLRAARQQGRPVIGTNHFLPDNLTYNLPMPGPVRKRANAWLWQTMLAVFNTLDAVTTPTETAAGILRQQGLRRPIQAISCGVEQTRFYPRPELDRAALRRRYGLDPAKTLLLYVGRVDREKELHILIQALDRLKRDDLQLAIVGKGSHRAPLKALCRTLALGQTVVFPGYVRADSLPLLFNSADIFAMPSRAELQSIATLEAMASGLPVLAAQARALPELVAHGQNGYLFEVGNVADAARGISILAKQRGRWPAMGRVSRTKATEHSLPNTIKHYLDLYQQVCAPPRRAKQPVSPALEAYTVFDK